jgi:hypothetical protein
MNLFAQLGLVQDLDLTALNLDQPTPLEVSEGLIHCLAAGTNRRSHVVLGKGDTIEPFQLDQVPRESARDVEEDDALKHAGELMDAGGETPEHELDCAGVALKHVQRVGARNLQDRRGDQRLDCALTRAILKETERAEEVAAAVEGDEQLPALLIMQEGLHEAVVDDEGVSRRIAPVIHNLAGAKAPHVHVCDEFSTLELSEPEDRQDVTQLIGHVPDGIEIHCADILDWPVQQRKQGSGADAR